MPLPPPRPGAPPPPRKLTSRAHAAVQDDITIDVQVRVAVLNDLESAADLNNEFEQICIGEGFRGPVPAAGLHKVGHMMTTDKFETGLTRGWFGKAPMPTGVARRLVNDMSAERRQSGTPAYLAKLRAQLDLYRAEPLGRVIIWYFHDAADPTRPMKHVAPELALRLALPTATGAPTGSGRKQDYIVFQFPAGSLADPRRPRFTDCCVLMYLDMWRPGGRTAPWAAGLSGLDELVDPPLVIGREAEDVHILECD